MPFQLALKDFSRLFAKNRKSWNNPEQRFKDVRWKAI